MVFAILVGLGLYYRRRPQVHKRLMLLATVALLPPPLARMRMLNALGPQAFFGVTLVFIVAMVAHDYTTRRRVHAVSVWGGLFLALSFPARIALGHTAAWLTFALPRSLMPQADHSSRLAKRGRSGSDAYKFHVLRGT